MGVTPRGLHYPDPTDRVTDAPTAIHTLATDIETGLTAGWGARIAALGLAVVRASNAAGITTLDLGSFGHLQDRNLAGDTGSGDSYRTVLAYNARVIDMAANTWAQDNAYAHKWKAELGGRSFGIDWRADAAGAVETWTEAGWRRLLQLSLDGPAIQLRPALANIELLRLLAFDGTIRGLVDSSGGWHFGGGAPPAVAGGHSFVPPASPFDQNAVIVVQGSGAPELQHLQRWYDGGGNLRASIGGPAGNPNLVVRRKTTAGGSDDAIQVQNLTGAYVSGIDGSGRHYSCNQTPGVNPLARIDAGAAFTAPDTSGVALAALAIPGNTSDLFDALNTSTGVIARITNTGNVQGTGAYTTLSDAAVKENITDLQLDPVDVITRLRPRHFDYIDGEADQVGFVAQEVADVLPQAVVPWLANTDDDDDTTHLGLRGEHITAYLVAALQAALARIDQLEAKTA